MREREQDFNNFMLGTYFADALMSTVCNNQFWRGKNGKPYEYPKEPKLYQFGLSDEEKEEIKQRKKQMEVDKFFAEQEAMRVNFQRKKNKQGSAK